MLRNLKPRHRTVNRDPLRVVVGIEFLPFEGGNPEHLFRHERLECVHALIPASDIAGARYSEPGRRRRCYLCKSTPPGPSALSPQGEPHEARS